MAFDYDQGDSGSIMTSNNMPMIEADSLSASDDEHGDHPDYPLDYITPEETPATSPSSADEPLSTSTKSVTDSVFTYHRENGRTYHGYRAGTYPFPNDTAETERLDFQYCVLHQAFNGRLHFAPLDNPKNILDIGTGTGVWAIEMGDQYPEALVEATDLSPIQPSSVPENVHFIIDDAEQEDWCVPADHYDYIHTRVLLGCFTDFRTVINQGFHHTKPGGWMESQEVMSMPSCDDGTMPQDWPVLDWHRYMDDAAMAPETNRPLRIANRMKKWYIEAGFVDVQEKVFKMPINTWPRDRDMKTLGKWWGENILMGLQGFSLAFFSRVLGWSKDEIEVYLVNVRKSCADRRVHAYHKLYVVWGRKPTAEEAAAIAAAAAAAAAKETDATSTTTPSGSGNAEPTS